MGILLQIMYYSIYATSLLRRMALSRIASCKEANVVYYSELIQGYFTVLQCLYPYDQ